MDGKETRDRLAEALVPIVSGYTKAELRTFLFTYHDVSLPIATTKAKLAAEVIFRLAPRKPATHAWLHDAGQVGA